MLRMDSHDQHMHAMHLKRCLYALACVHAKATHNTHFPATKNVYCMCFATAAFVFNLAGSESDNPAAYHSFRASYILDLANGGVTVSGNPNEKYARAHGILMMLCFLAAMPTAIIFARHRKFLPSKEFAGKAVWFWIHSMSQVR